MALKFGRGGILQSEISGTDGRTGGQQGSMHEHDWDSHWAWGSRRGREVCDEWWCHAQILDHL